MFKIVLDTNIFLSAFVFNGLLSQKIITFVIDKKLQLCVSAALEKEVLRKLNALKASKETIEKVQVILHADLSYEPKTSITISRDPNDNFLLELAETAKADFLITRDKDLLELSNHVWKTTKIVTPEEFLPLLRSI